MHPANVRLFIFSCAPRTPAVTVQPTTQSEKRSPKKPTHEIFVRIFFNAVFSSLETCA